ncbi:hypothetical protein L3X38_018795 [Prunus dulcis]|uniref:Uncharacterized protein n=1 Tax=Prunus dulcis TaxID=3755 RepID=A0AAD4WAP6_PRUDU|nr:hypothetical protein L3X38_018795 [Prunus dulcis]
MIQLRSFLLLLESGCMLLLLLLRVLIKFRNSKGDWHIYREKNGVADSLSNWSYNMDLGLHIFPYAPSWLGSKIVDDLLGVVKACLVCLNQSE